MVRIIYLLRNETDPNVFEFSDEEYFDPLEEECESFAKDGCARYQYPHKYINIDENKIRWIIVEEPYDSGVAQYRYQYLDGTKTYMLHSKHPNGDEEIIHALRLDSGEELTIRTRKSFGDEWTTTVNSLVDENENFRDLSRDWNREDRVDFGKKARL